MHEEAVDEKHVGGVLLAECQRLVSEGGLASYPLEDFLRMRGAGHAQEIGTGHRHVILEMPLFSHLSEDLNQN